MIKAYDGFASVYDVMQYDVDYDRWASEFYNRIKKVKPDAHNVLEVACGTATIGLKLYDLGLIVDGLDLSEEMLTIALQKAKAEHKKMQFFNQNMIEMKLNKKYDAILVPCDGMNYLLDEEEMNYFISRVKAHLNPGGVFIFDLSTEYKIKEVIGSHTFAETFETSSYIWENTYDDTTGLLSFLLTLFIENKNGGYDRIEEFHEQTTYSVTEMEQFLFGDFDIVDICDGDTFGMLNESSERVLYVCQLK